MKLPQKIIMILVGALVSIAVMGFVAIYFIERDTKNILIADHVSPDSRLKAIIFERSGGATTGFSTQVSVVRFSQTMPKGTGNVFIADTDHGKAPASYWGGPEVRVSWEGPKHLVIEHHKLSRVFRREGSIESITIEYKQFN